LDFQRHGLKRPLGKTKNGGPDSHRGPSYIAALGYTKVPGNSAPFLIGVEENLGTLVTTWLDKNTPLPPH